MADPEKLSRYRNAQPATDAEGRVWQYKRPHIKRKDYPDNALHVATQGEDCTLLAFQYLGDERLWWVIAEFNGIFNPLYAFQGGERLTIPSARTLYGDILPEVAAQ